MGKDASYFSSLLQIFSNSKKRATLKNQEFGTLESDINEARNEMNAAISNFDNARDPETVEFFIYKIKSLQIRYQNLLRMAKKLDEKIS